MPVERVTTAGMKIDDEDFERQLAAAQDIPVVDELRLIITGSLDVRKAMNEAKVNALMKARKKLAKAIEAEYDKISASHVFVYAQNQALDDYLDQGPIKVQS